MMKIDGERVILRPFQISDAEQLVNLLKQNREFWSNTEPKRPDSFYTVRAQKKYIKHYSLMMKNGTSYTFGIFLKESKVLVGDINLYEIKKAPFHSANVGYSLDQHHLRQGYGTESLQLVLGFAFNRLHLHRITAGVMPRNTASIRVLEKNGFQKEGLAREQIWINGRWEDHVQYAILSQEWEAVNTNQKRR